ncbi:MAG TPA: SGNH/GDSL hydrolase family protein, partial [Chitinophagales bacterium]|nr:SGNH/GDSL hydrolase family protein [Chitinophagales bacterium]
MLSALLTLPIIAAILNSSMVAWIFSSALRIALVALLPVLCYRAFIHFKTAPVAIRWLSVGLLVTGLIIIEFTLRKAGAAPCIIVAYESGCPLVNVIPPAQLQEQKAMQCDSFGINTFCKGIVPEFKVAPLNSDGFRCAHEFTQQVIDSAHRAGKKVLFFIGDSWTYGMNADSGKCYVSLLNADSQYLAMNAGIAGTDLPQYRAIVKRYIASGQLKPDHVIVCISRNDLKHIPDRVLTPNIPMVYYTNAGGLYSFQQNGQVYTTAADTYRFILNNYTLVGILGDHRYT